MDRQKDNSVKINVMLKLYHHIQRAQASTCSRALFLGWSGGHSEPGNKVNHSLDGRLSLVHDQSVGERRKESLKKLPDIFAALVLDLQLFDELLVVVQTALRVPQRFNDALLQRHGWLVRGHQTQTRSIEEAISRQIYFDH